jgi:UDP-GlcNAc:undecaprenyl-phosphate GlcNAc-1-phosphate transferase
LVAIGLLAVAASIYLVYVLEILKFKSFRAREIRRADPDTSEHEIDERVRQDLETGEFERVGGR